ncbi:CYTH [Mytilus coruscus]|uniref:CYTH n=1 Tax=Mytilus coruscus TaxID=42192 RepID=A0A6J8DBG4_MYTCO|nr:CYTH [Mytilus coruscus]
MSSETCNSFDLSDLTPEEKLLLDSIRKRKLQLLQEIQELKDEIADVQSEMDMIDVSDGSQNNPKTKQMSIGKKKFNMDPKKGIEYLIDHQLLPNTPEEVAKFLFQGEGLNKTAIGDYLGEAKEFNISVLKAFVNLHEFSDMILVQALRQFLWSFRLPGEAQKIDRMMECFAERYCELNPGMFTSTGISLYESIKNEPFKIPEDDGNDLMHTFFNPDKEGWLWKQGGRVKNWKRRWFILNDNCLYYFQFTTDKEPKGIIPLENIQVREVPTEKANKPNCFELYTPVQDIIKACKMDKEGKVVEGKHSVYRMSAATKDDKDEWIRCIKASISENPFYDMLAARRKKVLHQK